LSKFFCKVPIYSAYHSKAS